MQLFLYDIATSREKNIWREANHEIGSLSAETYHRKCYASSTSFNHCRAMSACPATVGCTPSADQISYPHSIDLDANSPSSGR